ncbi:putative serine protease EDA2 [Cytospora mali]|uniref:Serine protease EDA2 n=1 Tax=Cytospora mali TaxID=578113 RepID=A0A194UXY9_CYTMA|nr:putative serine protease EDA2 [Valsa mali var. pyri (nom. inval.)]
MLSFFSLLAVATLVSAGPGRRAISSRESEIYPPHSIDMPIDHFPNEDRYLPHTNATFKQHYYFDSSYYKPGGPVFLYVGGETSGSSRLSNLETGIIQILMNATGGLGVIVENRYYGLSVPFDNLTTDNLAYLTNEQSIADFAYFAQHVTFPGVSANLTAPGTPWIMYGGSLAGAQAAFTVKTYPEIIYGGIASSGVIRVSVEYPQWYNPVQKFAPSDCVQSINDIVDKLDGLLDAGNTEAVEELKGIFGLESLTDDRDFAKTIAYPVGGPFDYPTDTWQELSWTDQNTQFWQFCGNVTDIDAPENITAVDEQMAKYTDGEAWENLGNYANYVKEVILPTCPSGDYASGDCFGQGNATFWTEEIDDGTRAYLYTSCTEMGLFQAAPKQGKSLLSRVMTGNYTQEQCTMAFPPGKYNSIPSSPNVDIWNAYGGYDLQADRLAFIDGNQDPWQDGCYHSNSAPERYSTDLHPEYLIVDGGHHWDSYGILDVPAEPQFIREAHYWEIRTVKKWLRDFSSWTPATNGTVVVRR